MVTGYFKCPPGVCQIRGGRRNSVTVRMKSTEGGGGRKERKEARY